MRSLLRRLLVLLVALAFIAGGVGGFAAPVVVAADPCAQEHTDGHHHSGKTPSKPAHKQDSSRACQQCCIGICVSVPNIPASITFVPVAVTAIVFLDTARFGGGRSIKPEHGPPRLLA